MTVKNIPHPRLTDRQRVETKYAPYNNTSYMFIKDSLIKYVKYSLFFLVNTKVLIMLSPNCAQKLFPLSGLEPIDLE